jgi:hypothetical protein
MIADLSSQVLGTTSGCSMPQTVLCCSLSRPLAIAMGMQSFLFIRRPKVPDPTCGSRHSKMNDDLPDPEV